MRIAIGADHAGFELKEHLKRMLAAGGYEVDDLGTHDTVSTDYPDYAAAVAHELMQGKADRGILVCMTGMGMTMAANKVKGIRAALATNPEEVALTASTTTPTCWPSVSATRNRKRPTRWRASSSTPGSRVAGVTSAGSTK